METQEIVKAEAATQADETSCRAILDSLGDAVLVHDATTGEIREVNRKFCDLLGYSPEEARQLNIRDLAGDGHYPSKNPTPGQHPVLKQWRVRDRSGRQFRMEANLTHTVIQEREQICAVLRKIDGRAPVMAEQREDESFFRLVTEDSLAGVYLIQDNKFRYVNLIMAQKFGYRPEEIIDRLGPLDLAHPEDRGLIADILCRRLSRDVPTGQSCFRGRRRDGSDIHCEILSRFIEYQGRPAVMGVFLDITERKVAEEALKETQERSRQLADNLEAVFWMRPLNERQIIYINAAYERIWGRTIDSLMERPETWLEAVHPEDREHLLQRIKRKSAEGFGEDEYRIIRPDGQVRWINTRTFPVRDGKGEIYRVAGISVDITERKQAEEALKASEANYRTIFNAVDSGIAVMDLETGNFIDVNQKWCQMTGFNPEEARGLYVGALCLDVSPYTAADARRWIKEASKERPQVFEYLAKTKEGRRHWVEVNLRHAVIGGQERLLAVIRDISERRRAEEELRASEAKYRNLVEQIPAIIYVTAMDNLTGPSVYLNPQIKEILGFTAEEWLADQEMYKNRIHPEDRDRVLTELLLSYSQGGPFTAEYRMLSKSGRVIWIRDESRAVFDSRGRPLFVQGVAMDITKRKKSEEALREANGKLNALVQAVPLAIVGLDLQRKVISWNPAAERIFGWRQDEVIGRSNPIIPEEKLEEFRQLWQRLLQGEPLFGLELSRRKKDGSKIDVSLSTAPLYDAGGVLAGAIGIFEDITARKRTEEALRESEARFRAMFEGAPIGIALLDLQRTVREANPALREMSGYSEAELRHFRPVDLTHPDDREADLVLFTELMAGKRNRYQVEKRYRHKQGHWVWVRLSVSLVRDAAGQPQFAISMVEDITERKRAEKAAEEIRRQQEAILSNISDIAWLKDRESRFIVVNEQFGRSCGVPAPDLVGKTDLDIWPRDLALRYRADDQEVMRTRRRKRVEEPLADREGNIKWIETIKSPIFNEHQEVIGTTGIARDITERRGMEEALRQVSRALKAVTECHQALLRATNEAELLSEVCRIIVAVGGYCMAWVGYAQQDEGKSVEPMAHKGFEKGYIQTLRVTWADTEWGRGPVGAAIRTGKPSITRDTQSDPRFAPWREEALKRGFASVLALPLKDTEAFGALSIYATEPNAFDDEEINLLIGLANDLAFGLKALRTGAERRRAEEALRESETKYRSLMDGASDAIVLADPRGKITEVNRKVVELLGYPEAELLGMSYSQIHPHRILDHVMENFKGILTSGRGPLHECLVRRKDGEEVYVEITHNMVENGDHGVVQAVFRDITERQRAQEALRDSEQKLRLLASQLLAIQETEHRRVSRELHDELGQALTVLKIHLVAIENRLHRDQTDLKVSCEHLQNYIDAVIENVRRLSRDLSPSILEDLGLSSSLKYLIEEICRNNHMLYTVAMDEIDYLFSPEARINIYRIFQESLTNIVRHAEASRLDVEIKRENDLVTFRLKDDGKGFDLKRARSRSLGKRGLGLTAMHERALMSEGSLNIRSRKGKGTEITLTIPIQE